MVFTPATRTELVDAVKKWYNLANTKNNPTDEEAQDALAAANDYDGSEYQGNPNTWDVRGPEGSRITDMSQLFYNINSIGSYSNHPDISTWDVSQVTTMQGMFSGATAFNQPIGCLLYTSPSPRD